MGRGLVKLRLQAERAPEANHAERKRRMTEHARAHLNKICCAIKDGVEECHERYCVIHVRKSVQRRAAHVARKMTEQGHPSAVESFGVATQVGIDILNPDLHPDPTCRGGDNGTEAGRMECMGRSLLHHLSVQHGLSHDGVRAKMDEMGTSVGEVMVGAARAMGIVRERRGQARSAFHQGRAEAAAQAEALLGQSRRRRAQQSQSQPAAGRRLASERHLIGRDLGAHAAHAGSMRRQLRNASAIMHAGMMNIDRAAVRANNRNMREGHRHQRLTPRPDELGWQTVRRSVPGPLTALLAISSEEGSYASRFAGAVTGLNGLRDRVAGAMETHRRRLAQQRSVRGRRHRRRASEAQQRHADALYQQLEAEHLAREHERPQLPPDHALSWLHDLVDWHATYEEGARLYSIARARLKLRDGGAAHGDIVRKHPTGWALLDDASRSQPTAMGDALRRVLYRKETGADPPWHGKTLAHRVARRLEDSDAAPRPSRGFGASVRRLGVAFLESTVAAPFAFYDTVMPSGVTVEESEISVWEASLRYVISSTIGCYFVAPANEESKTQGGDGAQGGDAMKILRPSEEKLCFPAARAPRNRPAPTCPLLTPPVRARTVSLCDADDGALSGGDAH